jgi:hypothetical protein
VDDATEASAGWYWQFNRKQGYKHDGTTLTPLWNNAEIKENSDWISANDPCSIELGSSWHVPTYSDWNNVNLGGKWTRSYDEWNSGLKIHAAGNLYDGLLIGRGSYVNYWSSTQQDARVGSEFRQNSYKNKGCTLRCIRE